MTGRQGDGRFAARNPYAAQGGRARATVLTSDRRRAIAAQGFAGLVLKRFGGDRVAACDYLARLGAWAADQVFAGSPLYKPEVYRHPGPMPEGRRS